MFDDGVIDPFKVTRAALESAASIAALLITTETAIVEEVIVNPGAIMAPASAISPKAWSARRTSTGDHSQSPHRRMAWAAIAARIDTRPYVAYFALQGSSRQFEAIFRHPRWPTTRQQRPFRVTRLILRCSGRVDRGVIGHVSNAFTGKEDNGEHAT